MLFNNKRSFVAYFAALALPLGIVSCGLSLGDKNPEPKPLVISQDKYNCLSQLGGHISAYFADKMSNQDIISVTDCLANAIEKFERYTYGENDQQYKPEEFKKFLETYFVKDRKISKELMDEAMAFKVAVVGGNFKFVTRSELLKLSEFIRFGQKQLLSLKPYISIFNFNIGSQKSVESTQVVNVDRATTALVRVAEEVGHWMSQSGKSYDFTSFERFIYAIRGFSKWEEFYEAGHSSQKWAHLMSSFKSAMVRPPAHIIFSKDWKPLLTSAASWFSVWLKYKYQISNGPILYGKGLQAMVDTSGLAINLLRRSLDAQPDNVTTYDQIDKLIDAAGNLQMFPEGLRTLSLKKTARMLFNKIFGDSSLAPNRRLSQGLTRVVLARAEEEFYSWVSVQEHLDEGFTLSTSEASGEDGPNEGSLFRSNQVSLTGKLKPFPENAVHFIEMDHILKNMKPLYRPGLSASVIVYPSQLNQFGLAHGIHSLSRANVLRALVRLLFRGYSHRRNFMEGLVSSEMQDFYWDVRDLGTDLKIMDPRSSKVGERAFNEGNLFTHHSDGLNSTLKSSNEEILTRPKTLKNVYRSKTKGMAGRLKDVIEIYENPNKELLTFKEAMEVVAFVYSGGVLQGRIYSALKPKCKLKSKGLRGNPKLELNCVRGYLRSYLNHYLVSLPNMVNYLESLKGNRWGEILELSLETALRPDGEKGTMEHSELAVLSMIFHYSEVLMVRFDKNEDRIIDQKEIWDHVYLNFRGYLHDLALNKKGRNLDEGMLKSTFAFVVSNGRLPCGTMDKAKIWWDAAIRWDESTTWDLSLDRGDIIKLFGSIIKASKGPKNGGFSCDGEELDRDSIPLSP